LSLADMNRSAHIGAMIDAGISSFKIEGRLKDESYIKSVVAYYRKRIDEEIERRSLSSSSDGHVVNPFDIHPEKVFNRTFTGYFIDKKRDKPGAIDTPKWKGEPIGKVVRSDGKSFTLDLPHNLIPGDGISFFNSAGELTGTRIERTESGKIFPGQTDEIRARTALFRNYDKQYHDGLSRWAPRRAVPVTCELVFRNGLVSLTASDGKGNSCTVHSDAGYEKAEKKESAIETITRQLSKCADSEFTALRIDIDFDDAPPFIPVAELNALRRHALQKLREVREMNRPRMTHHTADDACLFFAKEILFEGNVLNDRAKVFYEKRGAQVIERAAESGLSMKGRRVMTTKYCLRNMLGICTNGKDAEELFLIDDAGKRYPLSFDCARCEMEIYY
ncbi:MAG TPA: DUF3656 domain-containing protein, partial [Spirochaetota bacterium]